MSLLWMYVFCSVVFRASVGLRNPLSMIRLHKPKVVNNGTDKDSHSPKTTNLFNTITSLSHYPVTEQIVQTVMSPIYVFIPEKDVCYEKLGCFELVSPWKSVLRPILAPMNPLFIQASVSFYSRENPMHPVTRELYPEVNLDDIPFNKARTTVIVSHGFASSGNAMWVHRLKNAYLSVQDVNMIILDWGEGAQRKNYLKVAGNTRVVGRELAILIQKLIDEHRALPKRFHLIGHSLGAHICAYAAKEIPGIHRLTALDPAQPGFEGFHKKIRLDKSDAEFVDVYHTDARPFIPTVGFGMMRPHGHVDFYFNGGFMQPGCLLPKVNVQITNLKSLGKFPVEMLSDIVSCPHSRSYEYFIESLDIRCTFWGRRMQLLDSLEITTKALTQGYLHLPHLASKCSPYTCIPVGLSAIDSPMRGSFIVFTENKPPYCKR